LPNAPHFAHQWRMPSYPDVPNPDLLDRLPLEATSVLDVGCGAGALGAEYKRRNPACCYSGIEWDRAAATTAATRLDRVANVDVEADPLPFGPGPFDCIVYGDVLEHLRDPWALLKRHAAALAGHGVVLISMPNAEHWSFAEQLLRGTWDYEPAGLFDRTHLRWFTAEMTARALAAAGLVPLDVAPRIFDAGQADAFVRALAPALAALGIDREAYRARAVALQHVWRAVRRLPAPLMLRSTMLDHIGGVSHVRVQQPLDALRASPGVRTEILSVDAAPAAAPADDGSARIFIFHRPVLAGEAGLERVRRLIAEGWLVLCEFDDHPAYLPALQQEEVHSFRAVHAVQTSTEPLAEVLRPHNPEVAVFPNAIVRLPDPANYQDPNRLTLFFAGLNREEDWPPLLPALNRVAALAGERLQFRIVADRALFDALETPHKSFTPLCDYETYQALLASSELSFMPLRDNAFNRCKSDLKFIEAAARRVTALASPVVYGASIRHGETGLLFRNPADLQRQLAHILAEPGRARAIAEAARAMVAKQRMLAGQVPQRLAWYHALWARRDALHRALLARVPELARAAAEPGAPLPPDGTPLVLPAG
jgi:SAM-dependent methyltransferase